MPILDYNKVINNNEHNWDYVRSSMRIPDPDNQNPKFKHFFKKIDKTGVFSLLKYKKILSS